MPPRDRHALIVRGGWDGHQPVETTDSVVPFLEQQGFAVQIESSPAVYADRPTMQRTDLIVQVMTMSTIEADEVAGLRAAVAAGTGMAGWHGGIVDAFRASSDYLQLVGAQFAAHPAAMPGAEPAAEPDAAPDYALHYRVEPTAAAADHPIMRGIDAFELETEQYWLLHDDQLDVLATTTLPARPGDPWHAPIVSPVVFTRRWGAGRIFVTTAGHDLAVVSHPSVRQTIERGMLWASR